MQKFRLFRDFEDEIPIKIYGKWVVTISWKGAKRAPSSDVAEMIEIDNRPNVITDLSQ